MPQKLSAMRYIKNNIRHVSVLIVSLALCYVLVYLTQFMLSSTEESIGCVALKNTEKMQVLTPAGKTTLGIDTDGMSDSELTQAYAQKNQELAEELREVAGVKNAWYGEMIYCVIAAAVGQMNYEMPLVKAEEIPEIINHFGAVLRTLGIDVRENYDTVIDLKWGEKFLKEEVVDVIGIPPA